MLRNAKRSLMAVLAAVAGAVLAPREARALFTVTNTGTVSFENAVGATQPVASGTANFLAQNNPVLAVVKTRDVGAGPPGTVVTWTVNVSYPRFTDGTNACNDDSDATNVVIRDAVPAGFTYNAGTIQVSSDSGATFSAATDAPGGDPANWNVDFTAGVITADWALPLDEGDGDGLCQPAEGLAIRFQTTKD